MAIRYNKEGKIIAHKFSLAQIENSMENYVGFCRVPSKMGASLMLVGTSARHVASIKSMVLKS